MDLNSGYQSLVACAMVKAEAELDYLATVLRTDTRIKSVLTFHDIYELYNFYKPDTALDVPELPSQVSILFADSRGLSRHDTNWISSLQEASTLSVVYIIDDHSDVSQLKLGRQSEYAIRPLSATLIGHIIDDIASSRTGRLGRGLAALIPTNLPVQPKVSVFLCHSSGDKEQVRELYKRLTSDGFQCWLDEENLLGGQDFDREITIAIDRSDYVLACISKSSVTRRGYIQTELKKALDVADQQPEGASFLIPLRLEESEIPMRLKHLHTIDLFAPNGYERLVKSLRRRTPDKVL